MELPLYSSRARFVNLSPTLRVSSPKATILSVIALGDARRVASLGCVGESFLLTRRSELTNPLLVLRSAMACEWNNPRVSLVRPPVVARCCTYDTRTNEFYVLLYDTYL